MEKYCDIIPHATGWVFIIDGIQSASCYHTYDLALEAARQHMRRAGVGRQMFRRQALDGRMLPVSVMADVMAGKSGRSSFSK